ncbi:MAG TPA: arginase [Gammaproteobacteria bacterium]|nr:arginase [Gammaproteobacteria bacterium]
MPNNKSIHLLGYASGLAGATPGSAEGPRTIKNSSYLSILTDHGLILKWENLIQSKRQNESVLSQVIQLCSELAESSAKLSEDKKPFVVLGGDHTSAIGTWSGVVHAKRKEGPVGLIWIDAHMDSHTPKTSLTGNLHGMPLASLLGQGEKSLTQLCDDLPKFLPENICLIGIRSYEEGEACLLKDLNVKIFYMDEVKQRGMKAVLADAIKIVTRNTIGYGLSVDIDSMDPHDAPGTGVPEPNGISANDLCDALKGLAADSRLIGAEIVEFDPTRDFEHKTEKLVMKLISTIYYASTPPR